jgi:hypothetical protein
MQTVKQDFKPFFENVWSSQKAQQLSDCLNDYAQGLVVDWLNTGKRTWHEDTWLRDMILTATVFQTGKKFQVDFQTSCRISSQAFNGVDPEKRVLTASQVEKIACQHQGLTEAFERIVGQDAPM